MDQDDQQHDSTPKRTRDGFPVRQGLGVMPGGPDTYVAYGRGWAQVSNTPFREYKHWTHEGGISTPLIAHWPAGMKTGRSGEEEKGKLVHEPCHLIDLMATAVDLAGVTYPKELNGLPIKPMEGRSLKALLVSSSPSLPVSESPRPLYWEHEGNRAVRVGDWKLVAEHGKPWELYHIAQDRSEQHDLSKEQPERVHEMAALYDAYAKRANVEPWDKVTPKRQPNAGKKGAQKQ